MNTLCLLFVDFGSDIVDFATIDRHWPESRVNLRSDPPLQTIA